MNNVKDKNKMSFLDHLGELRWHLVRSSVAIIIFAVIAFVAKSIIFDQIIFGPKQPDFPTYTFFCWLSGFIGGDVFCFDEMPFELLNMRMSGQFQMHLWVSMIAGLILAFPYVFWEIWRFVQPGLHENERKNSRGVILFTTILFALGVLFGYYVIVPLSVQFLGSYTVSEDVFNRIDLTSYISLVSSVTLATGILFQLPIAVYFLSKVGVVTPELLKTYRKHAIVGILLLSAIITPPDIASQVLVTLPVLILYQISIMVSRRIAKRKAAQRAAE